jgi:Tfp pilus assembly protein PilF
VEIAPNEPGFLDTYGWVLAENGDPERGLKILRDAYTRQSTNEEIRYHIALTLVRMERGEAARRELSAAIASERSFPSKNEAVALLQKLGVTAD